jgi:hypothetical protein
VAHREQHDHQAGRQWVFYESVRLSVPGHRASIADIRRPTERVLVAPSLIVRQSTVRAPMR